MANGSHEATEEEASRPTSGGAALLDDLSARGLEHDHTDRAALVARLDEGPTTLYCGFDPTADSLHIGNLQSIMLLRRFQDAGHAPIALVGGATGMIGDPSGRTEERQFLDPDVLDANRAAIGVQLRRFLDFDPGPTSARLVDNRTWTEPMGVLEFLRDVGKHVTINTMLAKESVQARLGRESGISFTEFAYMLLQAHDYLRLHLDVGCELQVAGSDQWGNITAGIDLVRRRTGTHVHGWTAPLIVRADGTKFGKSEGENIWLSAERTSPYRLYQYFLNVPDDDVVGLLLRLTTVPVHECRDVGHRHAADPGARSGQRRLAREITALVHGAEVIGPVEAAAAVIFGRAARDGGLAALDRSTMELLASELPATTLARADVVGADAMEVFVRVGLSVSKGEVRKNASGHYVNGVALPERDATVSEDDLLLGRYALLRRGKTSHHVVVVS
jgi:tyrosyl-tRNA synthetase